jgi:hypothetical protein
MTMDRDELRRLHFINALFAHVTGQDLYLAHQIKSAIAFSLAELEAQTAADPSLAETYSEAFNAAAAQAAETGSTPSFRATVSSIGTPRGPCNRARSSSPAPRSWRA